MKQIAFVTYNTVGENLSSGWHTANGRRALVLQNSKGQRWSVDRNNLPPDDGSEYGVPGKLRRTEIEALWTELQKSLPELDHVVIYLGVRGSERAIELASILPASKVTLVLCGCSFFAKKMLILEAGLIDARQIDCQCGGHQTMRELFDSFMRSGELAAA